MPFEADPVETQCEWGGQFLAADTEFSTLGELVSLWVWVLAHFMRYTLESHIQKLGERKIHKQTLLSKIGSAKSFLFMMMMMKARSFSAGHRHPLVQCACSNLSRFLILQTHASCKRPMPVRS